MPATGRFVEAISNAVTAMTELLRVASALGLTLEYLRRRVLRVTSNESYPDALREIAHITATNLTNANRSAGATLRALGELETQFQEFATVARGIHVAI